jgi:hypothetical protein
MSKKKIIERLRTKLKGKSFSYRDITQLVRVSDVHRILNEELDRKKTTREIKGFRPS